MYRKALIVTVTILAVLLVATGHGRAPAQQGDKQQPTPVGVWDVKGDDQANIKWIATMVLRPDKDGAVKGHIDWLASNSACGREHVTGTYDAKTRVLKLVGVQLEFPNQIVRGTYRAELSANGSLLEKGQWSDNDPTIPGNWSAKRISLK
jgi:hypothetical protein